MTTHNFLDQILPKSLMEELKNARKVGKANKRMESTLFKKKKVGLPHPMPEAGIII